MYQIHFAGIQIMLFFQSLGDWLLIPMQLLSFLGRIEFFMLIAPGVYWCLDAASGMRVAMALILSAGLNDVLKIIFHTPRPYWIDPQVRALGNEPSFGIPSGHAQNAVVVWGSLAYSIRKAWSWYLATALAILIGLSRLYLGVHFLSDILAGWGIGLILLGIYLRLERPVAGWVKTLNLGTQALLFLGTSLFLILLGWGIRAAFASWHTPQTWILNAQSALPGTAPINPFDITSLITTAGSFLGLALGRAWIQHRGGFPMSASAWQLVARFLLGVAGVLVLWLGLGSLLPDGETMLDLAFRYGRYALIGFWITGLAPAVFVRLSLFITGTESDRIHS